MAVVSREDPNRPDDENDRTEQTKQSISDLNSPVLTLCHVHEHEQLQECLNEGKTKDNP